MNRRVRIVLVAGSLFAVAVSLAACNTARGGGSIAIVQGGESRKATFGFQLVYKETPGASAAEVSGQFEYHDHAAKDAKGRPMRVSIHGEATGVPFMLEAPPPNVGVYTGTYKAQPEVRGYSGEPGTFTVTVVDNDQPGLSGEDTFTLVLTGGPFDGYSVESKVLAGGNITTF